MTTEVLAPGITEADSTEITVAAGVPVNVGIFHATSNTFMWKASMSIMRKDPNGVFVPTDFYLTADTPNQLIVGAGVYLVRRASGSSVPTGVMIDP